MIVGQILPPAADETRPPGLLATYRRVVRISALLLSLVACLALWAGSAHAEGSVTFYPTDKNVCGKSSWPVPSRYRVGPG